MVFDFQSLFFSYKTQEQIPEKWYPAKCVGINFMQGAKNGYPHELTDVGYPLGGCAPGPF